MRFGRKRPDDGWLPAFSVDTEEEAERLLAAACRMNPDGTYVAPELAEEQTLENLYAFGDRLARIYERLRAPSIDVGSVWVDRDPRSAGRRVEVLEVLGDGRVRYQNVRTDGRGVRRRFTSKRFVDAFLPAPKPTG